MKFLTKHGVSNGKPHQMLSSLYNTSTHHSAKLTIPSSLSQTGDNRILNLRILILQK